MNNRLEIPDELLSLIEKRDQGDRRETAEGTSGEGMHNSPPAEERRRHNRRTGDRPAD